MEAQYENHNNATTASHKGFHVSFSRFRCDVVSALVAQHSTLSFQILCHTITQNHQHRMQRKINNNNRNSQKPKIKRGMRAGFHSASMNYD